MKRLRAAINTIFERFGGLIATLLSLALVLIITLQACVFWLNTSTGNAWLVTRVNSLIQDTGYTLNMQGFALNGLNELKVQDLQLLQNKRLLVNAQALSLDIGLLGISRKRINLDLAAAQLELLNIPQTPESSASQPTVIKLPDTYFKQARLSIDIQNLSVAAAILGDTLQTQLHITQQLELTSKHITITGGISLQDTQHPLVEYLPTHLKNNILLDLSTQQVTLKEARLLGSIYQLHSIGNYTLSNQAITLHLDGEVHNPTTINKNLHAPIKIDAHLGGQLNKLLGEIELSTNLLGTATHLSSQLLRHNNLLKAHKFTSTGGHIEVDGELQYDLNTALASGQLKVALHKADLLKQFLKMPSLKGQAAATINLYSHQGIQALSLNSKLEQFVFQDISARSASLKLDAKDIKKLQKLTADATISDAKIATATLDKTHIKARSAGASYDLQLSTSGSSVQPFNIAATAQIHSTKTINLDVADIEIALAQGKITGQGFIKPQGLHLDLDAQQLYFEKMPFVDLSQLALVLNTAQAQIRGSLAQPRINLNYKLQPTILKHLNASLSGQSVFDGTTLSNRIQAVAAGNSAANAQLSMPMQLALSPFKTNISERTPLQGSFKLEANLSKLIAQILGDGYEVQGVLAAAGDLAGTLKNPQFAGNASLEQGLFIDQFNNLELQEITAQVDFKNRDIFLRQLKATDARRQGSLLISAEANLDTLSQPQLAATLTMKDMYLLQHKNYDVWLNADLKLENTSKGYLLSGVVSPKEILIRIPDYFDASIPELNIVEKEAQQSSSNFLESVFLDMQFIAAQHVFVTGRGLTAEFKGDLNISGNLKSPLVNGELNTLRGRFEEFGRRFALDQVLLRFQGAIPPSPYLDVAVSTKVEGIKAYINLSESVLDPQLKLSSEPALPQDEILSLILFGRNLEDISAFQALQLANTLRKFAGKGPTFDPLQKIQQATGLDDIYVEGLGTQETRVGAGKYITDKVYLEVEQGSAAASGQAKIEIEASPNITIESTTTEKGEAEMGVYWEYNY